MPRIQLLQGDLARIPAGASVDILVVSAFPNDYAPTPTSLIGALARAGVSVGDLARDKAVDLREDFGCWLSKDLSNSHPDAGFRRILCFEPAFRGRAPEVVGDLFRCLIDLIIDAPHARSVAMPLLASGDQQESPVVMLRQILLAASGWIERMLPLERLQIVVGADQPIPELLGVLEQYDQSIARITASRWILRDADASRDWRYDFFVSYSRADVSEVDKFIECLRLRSPDARVFIDRLELKIGTSWQDELDEAIEGSRKVIAFYSPDYFASKMCHEEFNMARLRHRYAPDGVLLPIYLRSTQLKLFPQSLQFIDCREADLEKLNDAADAVLMTLS